MASEPDSVPGDLDTDTPEGLASFWLSNISFAEKKVKQFRTRGGQIIRRYKNMRSTAVPTVTNITVGQRRMNVLWANVQTLKPVLYATTPKPNVTRRNKDKDSVGRWAAIVLERVLNNTLDMQEFDHVMTQDIEALLLPGYACSMVEYVPQVDNNTIGWQEAKFRFVNWKDQLTNPARYWQEVWWWGYVSYLTRAEIKTLVLNASKTEQNPEGNLKRAVEISQQITLDHKASKDADDSMAKATVWCIWDSRSKKIIQISTGYAKEPLAVMDPPVEFDDFYPIPRPMVATTATDTTIPVPDFDMYQDQADEIDLLTQRIYVLTRSLKVRALYPGDMQSIRQMMDNSSDADMIPIENWAMFAERGGLSTMVAYFPIEQVAKTLEWCYTARDKAMAAMYEITGISDIIRGASDPNETLGGQQLKAQFAGVRIRERQRDVQRYIRDLLRKMSSIIGQHFTLEVIQKMSGVPLMTEQQKRQTQQAMQAWQQFGEAQKQYPQVAQQAQQAGMQPPPPPQPPGFPQPPEEATEALEEPSWEQVMALLRDEKLRGFVIDIETDSTIEADQMAQQQKAEAFLTAVTQYVAAWAQILPVAPEMAPLAGEMLISATRLFKMGDMIETEIEQVVEKMEGMAQQPKPPDPQMQADQAKAQSTVAVAQIGAHTAGIKANAEQTKAKLSVVQAIAEHPSKMAQAAVDLAAAQQQPTPTAEGGE